MKTESLASRKQEVTEGAEVAWHSRQVRISCDEVCALEMNSMSYVFLDAGTWN